MTPVQRAAVVTSRLSPAIVALTILLSIASVAQGLPTGGRAADQVAAGAPASREGHPPVTPAPAAPAEIRGIKYHDRDYDGMREAGEEGLAGWTMVLTAKSRPGWLTTATTGPNGVFAFTGLTASAYAITEIEKPGWHNTNGLPHFVTVREGEIASTENEIGSVKDHAALTLTRAASPMTFRSAGEVIRFTYTVRNTGNVGFMPPFSITDDEVPVRFPTIERLVPRAEVSFAASYTVTPADVAAGFITSTAVARVVGFTESNTAKITCTLDRPVDTSLLISASHYAQRRHQPVTIYARLKATPGVQFAGCVVIFQAKRPGARTWTTVAARRVGTTTGKVSYRTRLHARGTYLWRTRFPGMGNLDGAISRAVRIRVRR